MHEKFGLSPGYQQNNVLSSDFLIKKVFFLPIILQMPSVKINLVLLMIRGLENWQMI